MPDNFDPQAFMTQQPQPTAQPKLVAFQPPRPFTPPKGKLPINLPIKVLKKKSKLK